MSCSAAAFTKRGDRWHRALLEQMAAEFAGIRPSVISGSLLVQLDEYRRFRHVVRNAYSYDLDPEQLDKLVSASFDAYIQAEKDLAAFSEWLESVE